MAIGTWSNPYGALGGGLPSTGDISMFSSKPVGGGNMFGAIIGGQAALEAAKNIGALTLGNMGAMAAQNRVLEANPTNTRFAGRYFRM